MFLLATADVDLSDFAFNGALVVSLAVALGSVFLALVLLVDLAATLLVSRSFLVNFAEVFGLAASTAFLAGATAVALDLILLLVLTTLLALFGFLIDAAVCSPESFIGGLGRVANGAVVLFFGASTTAVLCVMAVFELAVNSAAAFVCAVSV